jgi:hypothetical protein
MDRWLDDVPVPTSGPRMALQRAAGIIGATRPNGRNTSQNCGFVGSQTLETDLSCVMHNRILRTARDNYHFFIF